LQYLAFEHLHLLFSTLGNVQIAVWVAYPSCVTCVTCVG